MAQSRGDVSRSFDSRYATSAGLSTRVYNSTMIYDVLLVVVLGGIGLSGGRGGVRNVLVGLLIGVLLKTG